MKKSFLFLSILFISAAAMAQATPHEKEVLKNDLVKERDHRHAVAKDVLEGRPGKARQDQRAAVGYHERVHRDVRAIHDRDVQRARQRHPSPHHYRRHYHHPRHYRHSRHHARVVVEVRH